MHQPGLLNADGALFMIRQATHHRVGLTNRTKVLFWPVCLVIVGRTAAASDPARMWGWSVHKAHVSGNPVISGSHQDRADVPVGGQG